MYVTIPMKLASCCLSVGWVISVIPCIFFGQGCMPSALYSAPKNETLGHLSSNFLLFSTKPSIWATLRRLIRLASWSSLDIPYTTMSSWMLITPGHLSMMRSIFIWKTSCDILAPKGILLNLYLPLWVFMTSNLLLSLVRCTCRKALRASAFVKTTAPAS